MNLGGIIARQVIKGVAKVVLASVGGILVSKGYLDQNSVAEVIGAVMTIIGASWSVTNNSTKIQIPKAVAKDSKVVTAINKTDDPFVLPPPPQDPPY